MHCSNYTQQSFQIRTIARNKTKRGTVIQKSSQFLDKAKLKMRTKTEKIRTKTRKKAIL